MYKKAISLLSKHDMKIIITRVGVQEQQTRVIIHPIQHGKLLNNSHVEY